MVRQACHLLPQIQMAHSLSPAKLVLTCQPVATVFGDTPVTENVPSGFVLTDDKPDVPFPLNVMVFPPTPAPDEVALSLPDTTTLVPQGTEVIGSSVRVVPPILGGSVRGER